MKYLQNQPGIYCLNRGWKFIEQDISILPPTKNHDDVYGFSKGGAAKGPADSGYDDSNWETVELPHDFVTEHEFTEEGSPNQGYKERGICWYRIRFDLPEEDMGKQILLEFEGMSCDADIYVNGTNLKRSFSGYNSFSVDMTDMANFGIIPNTLAIKIDASAWEGWWYEGAGIYRNVWLLKKEPVHIGYYGSYFKPIRQEDGNWLVEVETTIENSFEFTKDYQIETVICDKDGKELGRTAGSGQINGYGQNVDRDSIMVNDPALWSPESPTLYYGKTTVTCDGKTDYLVTPIGFRYISLDAKDGFWLNGENIKLKGFCNHQDHAGVGVAVPYAIKEYRIKLLKELGANAYRQAHNPDPEILQLCDQYGLMVMEENRTYSSSEETLRDLEWIVKRARNHPSVILYSVFNEEPLQGTGKGRRMAGRMQALVKSFDDTRPVLGAFNGGYMEEVGASTILDATGINYNPGRYDDFHKKYPNTPLLGSETASAFMVRGEHKTDLDAHLIDNYDEECALWGNTVRDAWEQVNERPFVAGAFVWTGFDYRGEPTPFTWPSVATFFGTYDSCGFEKDACYLYKAFWKEDPIVHLVPDWNLDVAEGTEVKVMAFTNCEKVAIYLNGSLVEEKAAHKYDQVTFMVPYQAGELKAIAYRNGEAVAEDITRTAGAKSKVVVELSKDYLLDGGHDAVAINVNLVDAKGTLVTKASDMVHFEVTGGARIIGVGNGDPNSHEDDLADHRSLYHGKAQCIIRNTVKEDVTVRVSIDGVETETIVIPVKDAEVIPYVRPVKEQVVEGWKMYYQLFDEMPDPNPKVDANDMNSFEPIAFTGENQAQLADQLHKYGLYRAVANIPRTEEEKHLYFGSINGHVWIYIDGKEMARRTDSFGGYMTVDLPTDLSGEHVITVVIHNENEEWPQAGICTPVTIK
ncbi:beta-galactosidase [Lachnospiraceae bacterium KM106-2]|nr:beta-galactosidase [Lachnospiraceae bacterium KM106-2]